MARDHEADGRPGQAGWRPAVAVLRAALGRVFKDNLGLLAAGVAFYGFLSIFPAIAGALMVWGAFVDPPTIEEHLRLLRGVAPPAAFDLIAGEMLRIAAGSEAGLSIGAGVSLLLALWSASRATDALMQSLDVAYRVEDRRGFIAANLLAIRFTVGAIAFAAVSLAAIGAVPPILEALRLGAFAEALVRIAKWLLLVGVFMGGAAALYRSRRRRRSARRLRAVLPGAAAAAGLWLAASFAFSFYLTEFDAYSATFGSLGAVAALLVWMWISAYAIGLGAALNSELEARLKPAG
jgi:membrane protein